MKRIISIIACVASIYASDGTLDPSFGSGGTAVIALPAGLGGSNIQHAFIDAQGRIYMNGGNCIVRLTSSGALDTTFNNSGANPGFAELPSTIGVACTLLVQPDGRILVAGISASGTQVFITRFNSDGTFDQTFNNGQIVFTTVLSGQFVYSIALQVNGSIVIVVETPAAATITLVRYTSSGLLDSSFNGTGIVQTPITNGIAGATNASAVAINALGKIVIGGYALLTGDAEFRVMVAQYNSDGSLDTTFAPGGSTQAGIFLSAPDFTAAASVNFIPSLQIQPDGKLVIGTWTLNPNMQIVRLTAEGILDTSFNGTGFSAVIPSNVLLAQILLQSDGKIVAIGPNQTNPGFTVGRITTTGQLDTSFGSGAGFVTTVFSTNTAALTGALAQNGFILVAGRGEDNFAFARYEVATPLAPTTIQTTLTGDTGTAQPLSIVELFVDGQEVCATQTTTGTWSCTATISAGTHILEVVAHYPGGNVNIATTCERTFPQSVLSSAISTKYCPC